MPERKIAGEKYAGPEDARIADPGVPACTAATRFRPRPHGEERQCQGSAPEAGRSRAGFRKAHENSGARDRGCAGKERRQRQGLTTIEVASHPGDFGIIPRAACAHPPRTP